jgi:hypothetical protein
LAFLSLVSISYLSAIYQRFISGLSAVYQHFSSGLVAIYQQFITLSASYQLFLPCHE